MTKEERMNSLEIFVKQGKDLTTKELTLAGFSKYDLECLRRDVLINLDRGLYTFKDVNLLYRYGKGLQKNSKSDQAKNCFYACLEMEPNHGGAAFRLFVDSIKNKDYTTTFNMLDILMNTANEQYQSDYYLYLYLLSLVAEIPDRYKDIVANIKLQDIKVKFDDKRYDNVGAENQIRVKIYNGDFKHAMTLIGAKFHRNEAHDTNIVTSILIKQYITLSRKKVEDALSDLIKAQDYEELLTKLTDKNRNVYVTEQYLLLLTRQIIAIKTKGEYPSIKPYSGASYFEALKSGQYELALTLSEKYNNRINEGYNLLKLLLQNIIKLINERVPISDEKYIAELIKTNKYKELLANLEEKEKAGTLSPSLTYILILIRELLNIRKTGQAPLAIANNSANIYEAIDNKDFGRALYLSSQNRTGEDNNLFYLILADINYEIEKLQVKKPVTDTDYLELVKAKNYNALLDALMIKIDKRTNSQAEKYLSFLIGDLLSIKQTKKKPRTNYGESLSLFDAIKNQDYEAALNFIKEELTFNSTIINECIYFVLTDILAEIKSIEEKRNISVVGLIQENKYAEIISYYEQKKQDGPISINEEYILRLARDLINIKCNKPVPKIKSFGATTVFEAIDNNDYEKALNLSEKYCQKKGYNKNANPIYLLLDKISAETNTRKPKKNSFVYDLIRSRNYESIIKYYQDKASVVPLVKIEESILLLCQTIIDVKTNGVVPKMSISSSNSIFNLIDHGDYKKALSMAELYCEQKGIELEEHDLYCLLTDLFAEIHKIEEKKAQALSVTPALILEFIKNNEYEKLQNVLRNKKQFRELDFREEYLLKLADSYLNIKKTGIIPEVLCTNASSTSKAIDGNNYTLALQMLNDLERKGANNSNNSLYLMLEAIVSLTEKVKRNNNPIKETQTLANTSFETNNAKEVVTIDMIFAYLSSGKTDLALELVHKFLEQIGATKYEFLVVQAIKCSILEHDLAFIRPMSLLISLKNGTFVFELNTYLNIFYAACENGEFDLAKIYLEIIEKSKEVVPNNIDINWLKNTLLNAKRKCGLLF